MTFKQAVEQERQMTARRLEGFVPEETVVAVTDSDILRQHVDELAELWEEQGPEAAVRKGAGIVLNYFERTYLELVAQSHDSDEIRVLEDLSRLGKLDRLAKYLGTLLKGGSDSPILEWLIVEGLPQLTSVRRRLLVRDVAGLGSLVRVCDHLLTIAEVASRQRESDEWVYDVIAVLQLEAEGHGLLTTPAYQETIKQHLTDAFEAAVEKGLDYGRDEYVGSGSFCASPSPAQDPTSISAAA